MKTLWAFNPFHKAESPAQFYKIIKQLAGSADEIELGFLATYLETDLNTAFDIPDEERFSTYPRRLIDNELKKARISIASDAIHVQAERTHSTTGAVDALIKLAKSRQTELIALHSKSLKGFKRWIVGSFAETLIHRSPVNVLIANPKMKMERPSVRHVLFASDLSSESQKHLDQVIAICSAIGARLTVFHCALVDFGPEFEKRKARTENQLKGLRSKAELVVSTKVETAGEQILKEATKRKADLIAVAAKSSPSTVFMGGSVTRHIVRGSTLPVLVIRG